MKKTALINAELSYLVASLGHSQEITVCDAGLPIAAGSKRIDLALIPGVPDFITSVRAILSELCVAGVILAEEFAIESPELHQALLALIAEEERLMAQKITLQYLPHTAFKQRICLSNAVGRTGEFTPYANVILQAGVVF
mgnify:CR=1 FL=1